jgi:Mor family transcriptional regulator
MKPGVTYRSIARRFKNGYSILGLAKRYKCEEYEIQHAIRVVLNKNKRPPR